MAEEKIGEVEKIYKIYLSDYMQFLSFLIEKADVDEEEEKFKDQMREAKRHR